MSSPWHNVARLRALGLRLSSVVVFTLAAYGYGSAEDIDWKLFGGASLDGPSLCFYDQAGLVRLPERRIRVWTKCLTQKDLDVALSATNHAASRVIDQAAAKVVSGYVPPIVASGQLGSDKIGLIAEEELWADQGSIEPQSQMLAEFDCSQRMHRQLSFTVRVQGKFRSDDKIHDWEYVPSEGNAAQLLKLLCPNR